VPKHSAGNVGMLVRSYVLFAMCMHK